MTVEDPPFVLQADTHPAKVFRHLVHALFGAPVATYTPSATLSTGGGGHGVAGPADLTVTANGTPNMTVNVAAGAAFVRGSEASDQGTYCFFNDATVNLAIGTADGSNPRDDIIVAQVRDAGGGYSGSSNDARLFVVAGTPAASPVDPTLPVNSVALARVRVGTGVTSITAGNITDLRRRARTVGGSGVCTSTTRPTGAALYEGLTMWESDLNRWIIYDGTGWLVYDSGYVSYTPTLTNLTLGNGTVLARRLRQGPRTRVRFSFVLGSTSAVGTNPTFSLPFTAVDPHGEVALASFAPCTLLDTGTAQMDGIIRLAAGLAGVTIHVIAGSGATPNIRLSATTITATVPHTWANTDRIHVPSFEFEMADPYQV